MRVFALEQGQWLRWYDAAGEWIPTNAERATASAAQAQAAMAQAQAAEVKATAEAQAGREAIPRWSALELSAEQVAMALGLPIGEVGD